MWSYTRYMATPNVSDGCEHAISSWWSLPRCQIPEVHLYRVRDSSSLSAATKPYGHHYEIPETDFAPIPNFWG